MIIARAVCRTTRHNSDQTDEHVDYNADKDEGTFSPQFLHLELKMRTKISLKIPEYIGHPEYLEQGLRAVTDISGEWA